jgi:hypothetical protein
MQEVYSSHGFTEYITEMSVWKNLVLFLNFIIIFFLILNSNPTLYFYMLLEYTCQNRKIKLNLKKHERNGTIISNFMTSRENTKQLNLRKVDRLKHESLQQNDKSLIKLINVLNLFFFFLICISYN